jgi:hypothetical protein
MLSDEQNSKFDAFDGEILHPSLDIKNGLLVIGFRYRCKPQEEKEIFVVANKGNIQTVDTEFFTDANKLYFFDKRGRKLVRIEEKWSVLGLKQFLSMYAQLQPTTASPKELFNEIIKLAKRYIELEKEIDYYLLVGWIIGTYFYPIFYAYPFIHIKAPKRSGKSQTLNFLSQLCFNAVKAIPSLPALSDTVDSLRGTYLIDQADALLRKGNEELLDILSDSYKKGGGKRRVINFDKRRGREVLEFETYSPKVFASIKELPEDLRDRCFMIPLIRSQRNFPDPDDENENWPKIRGEIYKLLITNYEVVGSTYIVKKIENRQNKEVVGRSSELWLPFEVILSCFGMQEIIQDAKRRFLSQYGFTEYEPSFLEAEVVKATLKKLKEKQEAILTPKEISELIESEIFYAGDTPKQRAAKVGWIIKKFNLSSEKKPRTRDGVRYLFQKEKVENIYQSYFKIVIEPTSPTPKDIQGINSEQMMV